MKRYDLRITKMWKWGNFVSALDNGNIAVIPRCSSEAHKGDINEDVHTFFLFLLRFVNPRTYVPRLRVPNCSSLLSSCSRGYIVYVTYVRTLQDVLGHAQFMYLIHQKFTLHVNKLISNDGRRPQF